MSSNSIEILQRALLREKTARKQAEKILEEKSLRLYEITQELEYKNRDLLELVSQKTSELKGVFENIIDPYVVIDLNGNVLKMNNAAIDFFGYDYRKEPLSIITLVHKEDYDYTLKAFKILVDKGSFTKYTSKIISKDKKVKYVEVNSSVIFNKEGKPIAAQGIARDITEQVKNIELIEEQQKQLSVIVDNSPLGIVLTTKNGLIKCNKAFENFLGYTQDELKDKHIETLTYPDDMDISISMQEKLHSGTLETYNLKKRYVRKNGTIFWAQLSVSAVKNVVGDIKYEVALIEDISEQIKIEEDNKELLRNLELSNQELQEYAHIVSHDLKSPLRSISALTNWLKEDYGSVLGEEGVGNINMIENTVEKMDHLINDILNYSSINRSQSVVEDVNVYDVVNHIKSLIFIPKHVQVRLDPKLPTIKADKTRIQQLFQNLISNAVNYIDKEKGEVSISQVEEKNAWVFSIKDNGIGISKEYHKKIFDIFQSLGSHKDSTGIGLSIVKKIVDMYDGKIWLESEKNIGTTFYVRLKK